MKEVKFLVERRENGTKLELKGNTVFIAYELSRALKQQAGVEDIFRLAKIFNEEGFANTVDMAKQSGFSDELLEAVAEHMQKTGKFDKKAQLRISFEVAKKFAEENGLSIPKSAENIEKILSEDLKKSEHQAMGGLLGRILSGDIPMSKEISSRIKKMYKEMNCEECKSKSECTIYKEYHKLIKEEK